MSYAAASGAAGAGAAGALIAQAIRASGTIVRVESDEFLRIVGKSEAPLVVQAPAGLFGGKQRYLTAYKGLAFVTDSSYPLQLPASAELVAAKKIWVP